MNKVYKKYVALAASAILGVSALVGCSAAAPTIGTITGGAKSVAAQEVLTATDSAASGETTAASASADATGDYSKKDLNTDYDAASAVTIALNGDSIAAEGQGVATDGSTVTISAAGTYILSGSLTDGQIIVNAKDMDDVQLVLDGVDLYCSTSAPIYVKNADKVILTLAKGSQNTVKDSDNYTYADAAAEEPDAAIFSKVDLSINGSGSLTVEGSFNDALGTKDDLTITGGTIDVTAVGKGLHGRDSISVLDGDITVSAGGDGMQSNNDEDTTKGWIILDGGTFHITAGNDAIQAETALTVNGGTFNLTSGGGSANAEQRSQDAGFGGRGQVAQPAATDATATESYKGMKAGADLVVNTGTFTINSADDAVHSNGNAAINGGVFEVATGDDGVHADGDLTVHADITISTCYEGLEGGNVTIDGGNIGIASSDDGLNAAGGSDETTQGMFGQDRFSGGGNNTITINDGTINMLCGGDGVDSNGDFNMAGGRVVMLISSSPDNGGVDCDGTFTATGGAIVYGGTGTGSNPGGNSTQSYVYFNNGVAAGTEVTLRRDGQTILSFTPAIDCQHIAISSPDIVSGNTHSLYSGSSEVASATAGTGGGDMMGRGGMPGGGMPGGKPQN